MKIKPLAIRATALVAGFVVFFIALQLMDIGGDLFTTQIWITAHNHDWLLAKENWPTVPGYDLVGETIFWAYPACAGLIAVAVFWQGWPNAWKRAIVYLIIVILIAPISWVNYATSDQWLNLWIQALFNLLMAAFFLTVVYGLRSIKSDTPDLLAIQSVGILMLTSFGVFLPLFYTSVFLARATNAISHHQVSSISDNMPLLFAGGAGAVATFLAQLDKLRRQPNVAKQSHT
jgi:hypothetical protein